MRDYLEKLMQANDLTMDEIGHVKVGGKRS